LKNLSEKRIRENQIISTEILISLTEISKEINKQIGLIIDRNGNIVHLIVGNDKSIEIPYLERNRSSSNRLRGLRLVHTHLKDEELSDEDLTDLVLLKLDLITAVTLNEEGLPKYLHSAHLNPDPEAESAWIKIPRIHFSQMKPDFIDLLNSLEEEINRSFSNLLDSSKRNRALLVGVYTSKSLKRPIEHSIQELKELCRTAEIYVVETFTQKRNALDPSTVMGKGKLQEILLKAVQKNIELLVFDLELSPSQAKVISDFCDLKVIDRTQLILDIFAKNAKSRDGKLQVEMAQLKYLKGRLSELDDNMSRLTGGIGGRGPGETKLEIGKRRVEERINRLDKELGQLKKRRELNRKNRSRNDIPVVSIVGYTNAGKSTLLNALTNSDVIAENKLFATLDPTTRRVRFPKEREIILSDTVGFIHDLPPDLSNAFKATLEELGDADLLLHIVDISDINYKEQIKAVEKILDDLDLMQIPRIIIYNKIDNLEGEVYLEDNSLKISSLQKKGLEELLVFIENTLWNEKVTNFLKHPHEIEKS
jgi:GTPase